MLNTALHHLEARLQQGRPLRVGLIGVGSFGRMVLSQLGRIRGIQIVAVADADRLAVREAVEQAEIRHPGLITDEVDILFAAGPDVVIEATGTPVSGVAHAVAAIEQGCHVIMANSAADALAGPELARRARAAGLVYSLAQGDRPALICDLVSWARASGFEVMAAGRGAPHRRGYHSRTPDTVWDLFDYTEDEIRDRRYSARNFTSLIDGTQSAMEMASVANACGLIPQTRGLLYPPCGTDDLAEMLVPQSLGGVLDRVGTVEVVSSVHRDGAPVAKDLRYSVYVTLSAPNAYVARMFRDFGLAVDSSGQFASIHRPVQLLGLETPVSVLAAGILGEDTGSPTDFVAEVATVAKRDLSAGQTLDGIGGYSVYGRLMPAHEALTKRALPIGLAEGRKLVRAMPAGSLITCDDVAGEAFPSEAVALRPGMVLRPRERERIIVTDHTRAATTRAGSVVDPDEITRVDSVSNAGVNGSIADTGIIPRTRRAGAVSRPGVPVDPEESEDASPPSSDHAAAAEADDRSEGDAFTPREGDTAEIPVISGPAGPADPSHPDPFSGHFRDSPDDPAAASFATDVPADDGATAVPVTSHPSASVFDGWFRTAGPADVDVTDAGALPNANDIPVPGPDEAGDEDDESTSTDTPGADERTDSSVIVMGADKELARALRALSAPESDDNAIEALLSGISDDDPGAKPNGTRSSGAVRHAVAGDGDTRNGSPEAAPADPVTENDDPDPASPAGAQPTVGQLLKRSNGGRGVFAAIPDRAGLSVPDVAGTPSVVVSDNGRDAASAPSTADGSAAGDDRRDPLHAAGDDGRTADDGDRVQSLP